MANRSEVRCATPRCIQDIEQYGENYHGVNPIEVAGGAPPYMPDATDACQRCGGYWNGKVWMHRCRKCAKDVEPGKLVGLFVPHLCTDCAAARRAADIASGNVCTLCRQPRSECCC